MEELKQQVKELTTQVASIVQQQQMPPSAQQPPMSLQCCFTVIKDTFNGIVLNVKAPIAIALHMVSQAMLKRIADRETTEAHPCQAAGTLLPVGLTKDQVVTVSVVKSSAATLIGKLAGKSLKMILDSGSAVLLIIKVVDNLQEKLTNTPIP